MLTHLLSVYILQNPSLILLSKVHLYFAQYQQRHTLCFMLVCKVGLRFLPTTFALTLHSDTYLCCQVRLCRYTQNCYDLTHKRKHKGVLYLYISYSDFQGYTVVDISGLRAQGLLTYPL
jgi:hypothetical protein